MQKAFQHFLAWCSGMYVSEDVVLQFLPHLFHEENLKPTTIAVFYAASKDALTYGSQLTLDSHLVDLIWKEYFHQGLMQCLTFFGPSRKCWTVSPSWTLRHLR